MNEPPWDELDTGIRDVVRAFWRAGLKTIASCQGHGHGDAWVVVPVEGTILTQAKVVNQVIGLVQSQGWEANCIVEACTSLQSGERWVTARWWGRVPFR